MEKPEEIIQNVKDHLYELVKKGDSKFAYLPSHISQVELWSLKIISNHPEVNKLVLSCSVWLHDIGLLSGSPENDHAVNSEVEARNFLTELNLNSELISSICHCVRSHRNRDIKPQTIEAKVLAAADSASHMTDGTYVILINRGLCGEVGEKIERDYKDIGFFPDLAKDITPFYMAWKEVIREWPNELIS